MTCTPTERIRIALCAELADRSAQIDAGKGLRSIRMHVRLNDAGQVIAVEYSEVSERRVPAGTTAS